MANQFVPTSIVTELQAQQLERLANGNSNHMLQTIMATYRMAEDDFHYYYHMYLESTSHEEKVGFFKRMHEAEAIFNRYRSFIKSLFDYYLEEQA